MKLIGRTITNIRAMTVAELEYEGWTGERPGVVIELDDGSTLYPSRDEEGNGPGAMFGADRKKNGFHIFPTTKENHHGQ